MPSSKIEGMYSFAIYDQHMATITLARDFAGQNHSIITVILNLDSPQNLNLL